MKPKKNNERLNAAMMLADYGKKQETPAEEVKAAELLRLLKIHPRAGESAVACCTRHATS